MALKVQYTVKRDTNILGILRWKKHGAIIKSNRWKLQSRSKLRSNDQELTSIYLTTSKKIYPINRLECERLLQTNSMKKDQKKNKSGNHQHINETPFHVDLLCHPAERYITNKGSVPKPSTCGEKMKVHKESD